MITSPSLSCLAQHQAYFSLLSQSIEMLAGILSCRDPSSSHLIAPPSPRTSVFIGPSVSTDVQRESRESPEGLGGQASIGQLRHAFQLRVGSLGNAVESVPRKQEKRKHWQTMVRVFVLFFHSFTPVYSNLSPLPLFLARPTACGHSQAAVVTCVVATPSRSLIHCVGPGSNWHLHRDKPDHQPPMPQQKLAQSQILNLLCHRVISNNLFLNSSRICF